MTRITLAGVVENAPEFSHQAFGEKFYSFNMITSRESGTVDIVPCIISEVDAKEIDAGDEIKVIGEIRTRNLHREDGKTYLEVRVFVHEVLPYEHNDENLVEIQGYTCKAVTYRDTPLGRKIADIIIASNREMFNKSDYIPCIAWGRNAIRTACMEVGTNVSVVGRFQSREYIKRFPDGTEETRTAYEVSIGKIYVVEETEE